LLLQAFRKGPVTLLYAAKKRTSERGSSFAAIAEEMRAFAKVAIRNTVLGFIAEDIPK
jgi:hypothetical protein